MDATAQSFIEIIGKYEPEIIPLFEAMMGRGASLTECLELTQFNLTYEKLYELVPKDDSTVEFIIWLLPRLEPWTIVNGMKPHREYLNAEVWGPILRQVDFNGDPPEIPRIISYMLWRENYEMLDVLYEVGFSFREISRIYYGSNTVLSSSNPEKVYQQLRYLLEHGGDPNTGVNSMVFPILTRFLHSRKVCELLVEHGANPNVKNINGIPVIYAVMTRGSRKMYELFMSVKDIDLTITGCNNNTLLHICRFSEFWPQLIEAGISINALNANKKTPLMMQLQNGTVKKLETFLKLGPDLEVFSSAGHTVLYTACRKNLLDKVKLLVRYGADPDARPDPTPGQYQTPRDLLRDHPRYNELFNHNSVKRAE